jgi:hypothetical protein
VADDLMNNNDLKTIHIHQLLHGYDEGHRMLSGSIKPDGQTAKTLLTLSDLSGQGGIAENVDYITGYPLSKMGAYALAKTWMAPEMPRPGCGWTHTLLIDFSDLAAICSNSVLKLFRRPAGLQDIPSYQQSLIFEINTPTRTHNLLPGKVMRALLAALYESPMDCVFIQRQKDFLSNEADEIAMALWLQQWPRLRRNFRFCTWTPSDRSRANAQFDLQFIPHKKYLFNNNRKGTDFHWVDITITLPNLLNNWLEIALSDATYGDRNSRFRDFLWRYGAETEAGRAAFCPLAQAWQAIEDSTTVDIDALIVAVSNLKPAIISLTLRTMQEVAQYAANATNILSLNAIEFLIQNLAFLDDQMEEADALVFATTIWRHAPEKIWLLFKANTAAERLVAVLAAKKMQPLEALEGSNGDIDLFCAILRANLKLAASPLVWEAPAPIPQCAANIVSNNNEQDIAILFSMMEADNTDVPALGLGIFGQVAVNTAIEQYDSNDVEKQKRASRWLLAAKQNPKLILAAISKVSIKHIETLAFIASLVDYRYPSASHSEDEWVRALTVIENNISNAKFEFYAFLLGRAFSGTSPDPGSLIHFSFDSIHSNLTQSRYSKEGWVILEPELPEVPWWITWDRAYRVRLGVVKVFIYTNLPPNEFFKITKDENVFVKLVEIAASSQTGRAYLRRVSSWVLQSNRNDDLRHLWMIAIEAIRSFEE